MSSGGYCPGDCCSVIRLMLARDTAPPIGGTNCNKPPYTPAQWDNTHYMSSSYIGEDNTYISFLSDIALLYYVENIEITAIQPNKCR